MFSFNYLHSLLIICILVSVRYAQSGYKIRSLELLLVAINSSFSAKSSLNFLEFGNQRIMDFDAEYPLFREYGFNPDIIIPTFYQNEVPVGQFFEFLGYTYTSIDYNGLDGSLSYDVRSDLRNVLTGRINVITNLGFSEHVGEYESEEELIPNQYRIFKNFHNLGDVGTLYYHEIPMASSWRLHGVCGYELSFLRELARHNNYQVNMLFVNPFQGKAKSNIVAVFEKVDNNSFMSFDDFKSLPGLVSRFKEANEVKVFFSQPDGTLVEMTTGDLLATTDSLALEARQLCRLMGNESEQCVEDYIEMLRQALNEQRTHFYGVDSKLDIR